MCNKSTDALCSPAQFYSDKAVYIEDGMEDWYFHELGMQWYLSGFLSPFRTCSRSNGNKNAIILYREYLIARILATNRHC